MKEMAWFLRQMSAMSTEVQYSKSKKEKNSINIAVKVLIFLAPKTFFYSN